MGVPGLLTNIPQTLKPEKVADEDKACNLFSGMKACQTQKERCVWIKKGKKCTAKSVDWTTVVAGNCASEASAAAYSLCIQEEASCAACLTINGGYGLSIDCDLHDNGVADSSCGSAPSPRGAFVDGPVLF